MKFFNLDCHISVIEDIKTVFTDLGHTVDSWSLSGHNWVLNRQATKVDIVNEHTWTNLNQQMCDSFYERYKNDLSNYDAFICGHPPCFSLLYKKFNKPIISQCTIRYEVPFSNDKNKWNMFNDYLRESIDQNKLFVSANSLYDKKYFEFFVNRSCTHIPSLCEYTKTDWAPEYNKFLYSGRLPINFNNDFVINKNSLGKYEWRDLTKFLGIIIIPYNCSLMSIFEHYTANIPLFFPSKNFMMELYKNYKQYVLSELTWNQVYNLSEGSVIDCDQSNDPNKFNDFEIMSKWIDYSDFYNQEWFPHITYFDSFDDLQSKLNSVDLKEINNKLKIQNAIKKEKVYNLWNDKLNNI